MTGCGERAAALFAAALFAAAILSGCGSFVVHQGERPPAAEAVTLECYWRHYLVYGEECHVSAVDGNRTGPANFANLSAEFGAGRRWIEFNLDRYIVGIAGSEVCAFEHDFAAGHRYRLLAHSFEAGIGWGRKFGAAAYTGTMTMEQTGPAGERSTHELTLTCIADGGSLCRTSSDCAQHPDVVCRPLPGHPYGKCGIRD